MRPIDYRNATWRDVQKCVYGARLRALNAWRLFGPGTTREVSKRSGIDLLTLRPRTTELVQLGLVVLADSESGHEGTYRALGDAEAMALFQDNQAKANGRAVQAQLL